MCLLHEYGLAKYVGLFHHSRNQIKKSLKQELFSRKQITTYFLEFQRIKTFKTFH